MVKSEVKNDEFRALIDPWLEPYWKSATPGLCLEVYQKGQKVLKYSGGESFKYYDLASLTKVLFTVPAMILAMKKGFWNKETKVQDIISWWPHSQIKIVDLLTHSSGLMWWKPFYKDLELEPEIEKRWEMLKQDLIQTPIEFQQKSVYSDLGFLLISFLLRTFWAPLTLSQIWDLVKLEFGPETSLHWIATGEMNQIKMKSSINKAINKAINKTINKPISKSKVEPMFSVSDYAPTELCPWRGRRLQAEVHDENAWVLGGLSTHSGLFGSVSDVASIFLKFRSIINDGSHPLTEVMKTFIERQVVKERGDWALGFMMPTVGGSSSGQYFSEKSIGHTGFTGTSVWWDPISDLLVVLLSNRVYFGREQREFAKLRPLLHDKIVQHLNLKH